jgi:hypothetical protein
LAIGKLTAAAFGIAADDWSVLQTARPNVLIIGSDDAVAAFLDLLRPLLQSPVSESLDGERILPSHTAGTLILRELPQLDAAGQDALASWLAQPDRQTQVISTSSCAIYPLVENETISASLYYSLNVIMLSLRDPYAPH